jgi:hypothetical protein
VEDCGIVEYSESGIGERERGISKIYQNIPTLDSVSLTILFSLLNNY